MYKCGAHKSGYLVSPVGIEGDPPRPFVIGSNRVKSRFIKRSETLPLEKQGSSAFFAASFVGIVSGLLIVVAFSRDRDRIVVATSGDNRGYE